MEGRVGGEGKMEEGKREREGSHAGGQPLKAAEEEGIRGAQRTGGEEAQGKLASSSRTILTSPFSPTQKSIMISRHVLQFARVVSSVGGPVSTNPGRSGRQQPVWCAT